MRWIKQAFAFTLALAPLRAFAACDAPVYRQFDFWIGNWRVTRLHRRRSQVDDKI
jgi:hypothetical protein